MNHMNPIIDAHVHLWEKQSGLVNGRPVYDIGRGRSDFGGEVRQMLPPYLTDGKNTASRLLANMDYAQVSGCVVTQEYIDGNQDDYLLRAKAESGGRMKICSLYEDGKPEKEPRLDGFDGVKFCGGRMKDQDLTHIMPVFERIARAGKFVSIDMADGAAQTGSLREVIKQLPNLRIAIGHFGMCTVDGWEEQIKLAAFPNVRIESGGITWLFHEEFYPYPTAVKKILRAAELVGFDKLMWGSDYPRTMTAITYLMSLDFIQKSKELTEAEKAAFLGGNAERFYGFDPLPVPEWIHNMVD